MQVALLYLTLTLALLLGIASGYVGPWITLWIVFAAAVLLRQASIQQRHRPTR